MNTSSNSNTTKIIVVFGATGQQGGAVARALRTDKRWRLRVITRNPASDAAQMLAAQGFEVVAGDMNDPASLQKAFTGAHGVFSVQATDQGHAVEVRHGRAVVDAAVAAGIAHFVYASVGGADRDSGIAHFESKWQIEKYIRSTSLPATIVRPAFFMENFNKPTSRAVLNALMRRYIPQKHSLQMIAVDDIGKWVAHAFAKPETFIGRAEEIAGDALTRQAITQVFKSNGWFAGLPFPLPRMVLNRLPKEILTMFEWFGKEGYRADIPALRRVQPELLTLDEWLKRQ